MVQQRIQVSPPNSFLRSLSGSLPVSLPADWQLLTLADFPESHASIDAGALALQALQAPYGSSTLDILLTSGSKVCILIEDLTRTSPKKILLEVVLNILRQKGIPSTNISIVIALGTHRPLSSLQLSEAFGPEIVDEYAFVNHDCHSADLCPIGRLAGGTEVRINKRAYDADFRIGIG